MALDDVLSLPDAAVVARAACMVGVADARIPLDVWAGAPSARLAVTRTALLVVLDRLEALQPVCPSCVDTPLDVDCAREMGALQGRLDSLASQAARALAASLPGAAKS
jgi:hypothetical protein